MKQNEHNHTVMDQAKRDPMWFLWFLTFVVSLIYVLILVEDPQLRQSVRLIPFTLLTVLHVLLHWQLTNILKREKPGWSMVYILVQGAIALTLVILSKSLILPIAIFMGLIGEGVGLYGLSLKSVLSTTYYLILGFIGLLFIPYSGNLWGWALGLIPILFFVIMYVILYQRQLEAKEKAQNLLEKLEAANRQLSEYAVRVEDLTILAERQRMARDLHDTLSQGLAGIILQLEAIDAHLTNRRYEKAGEIIHNSMERARATLSDARQTIGELRGESTIRLNLMETLQEEIDQFVKVCDAHCELVVETDGDLSSGFQDVLQRLLSEALNNIARHANASSVMINLGESKDEIVFLISDDGCGFDPQLVEKGHYGLLGIRERVKIYGGEFILSSRPGSGTTITVRFPKEKAYETD